MNPEISGNELPARKIQSKLKVLRLQVGGNKELQANTHAGILLRKLESLESGGEILDNFDGQTIKLLNQTLGLEKHRPIMDSLRPLVRFGNKWLIGPAFVFTAPKVAGYFGGEKGGEMVSDWATNLIHQKIVAQGDAAIQKVLLQETGIVNQSQGAQGMIGQLLEKAQQLTNDAYVYAAQSINLAVQNGGKFIVEEMAKLGGSVAGTVMWPVGAIGGYLVVSFGVGGVIGLVNEHRQSSGFEPIFERIKKSEKMIKDGERNKDKSDPRTELIVFEDKLLSDPKRMGYTRVTNVEWLSFAVAVRNARVSILRDKTGGMTAEDPKDRPQNILVDADDSVRRELERKAEVVKRFIDAHEGIAEADEQLAGRILEQYCSSLEDDKRLVEGKVRNRNTFLKRSTRYSWACVKGGMNGTGVPLVVKTTAQVLRGLARITTLGV